MDYLSAVVLGIVQGITEFVPISSSGHLVLLHEALQFSVGSDLVFDVALHAGTLLAILIFFRKDSIQYFRKSPQLLCFILLSMLPAAAVGVLFEDAIDHYLRSSWVVVVMLVIVSLLFFFVEARFQPRLQIRQLQWWQALLLGCAQAVALIPGTSRSGITMATGMWFGLARDEAARFSFLMTVPLLVGLVGKEAAELPKLALTSYDLQLMAIGTIVSALVGIVVIRYLLAFLKQYSLRPFAWYRLGLAVVVSLVLLF